MDKAAGKDDGTEDRASVSCEPGASIHGNFINYYQFHSAAERIRQLPSVGLIDRARHNRCNYVVLDIGCNTGDLTLEIFDYLKEKFPAGKEISILGIDLDPLLIERARQKNYRPDSVTFECLNFMSLGCKSLMESYLSQRQVSRFDVSFCFSITMWIHLNEGDAGLERFLQDVCSYSETVLLEPQPWRCYRNASRRLRRAQLADFPLLEQLKYRGDMQHHLQTILREQCGFRELALTNANDWQRRLLFYARPSSASP